MRIEVAERTPLAVYGATDGLWRVVDDNGTVLAKLEGRPVDVVLLTGEVPDQGVWASVGSLAKSTEKVRVVNNELVVAPNTDLSSRSNDTYITSKVKTRMIEANKFPPNVVKVVTERGVVYLMGIVSMEEGAAAGETAATTAGVVRVVKLFQYKT